MSVKLYSPTAEPLSIGLTSGHMLVIERAGTEVPPPFRREAIARGALTSPDEVIEAPEKEFDRSEVIEQAIMAMLDGDNPGDFKADGTPNLNQLTKRAGFTVQREEAAAAFAKVTAEKQ